MDLLEYQAKEIFHEMGIPVLPSQRIDHPKDLKGLKVPYPVVLKSQVYAGGRGKAGGIKFVENTIDAVAAAQLIFNLPILGEYPEVLLAEAKYDADQEFYLAVILDRSVRRPVLLGSQQGGIGVESAIEQMQQVIVDQEFSPFYARRLALKMGLTNNLIQSVSFIIEKMYQLFVQKDLDLVEINPLAVSRIGEVMALDGKVIANDDALGRHADLTGLVAKIASRAKGISIANKQKGLDLVGLEGNIGIVCNGAGLTMSTLDLVYQVGGKPANFLNVGGASRRGWTPASLSERIEQGLELITQSRSIKVVLVNILGSVTSCDQVATSIIKYLESRANVIRTPQFVARLVGTEFDQAQERLATVDVPVFRKMDEAIARAVSLAKSK